MQLTRSVCRCARCDASSSGPKKLKRGNGVKEKGSSAQGERAARRAGRGARSHRRGQRSLAYGVR
eukprot:7242855-Prymnesium_polylepis.1